MSRRNSRSAKQSARERLREERRRQARAAARRTRTLIGAAVATACGALAALTIALAGSGTTSGPLLVLPANTSGPDGTVIVYGNPKTINVLDVYEDFRDPICDKLEKTDGSAIQQLADDATYVIHYHLATITDADLRGRGSRNALAAAGAALNENTAKFKQFHDVLYANQPPEHTDSFAETGDLLDLAKQVPGLTTPAFTKAVQHGTFQPWADKVGAAFRTSGVTGVPTLRLNGKQLTLIDNQGNVPSPAQYTQLIRQTLAAK